LFVIALICDDSKKEKKWIEFFEKTFQLLVDYYFEVFKYFLVDERKSEFSLLFEFEERERGALLIS